MPGAPSSVGSVVTSSRPTRLNKRIHRRDVLGGLIHEYVLAA
jgi:hypothetical protein